MSLKAELEVWTAALSAYDGHEYDKALEYFSRIACTSKVLVNMGLICATMGEHELAVKHFLNATSRDQYLAVAYFQSGVSNFLLEEYRLACHDFDLALIYLRGHLAINYNQLGLDFTLFSTEIFFNKGLSKIYLGRMTEGLEDMKEARRQKVLEKHNAIDEAILERGDRFSVFSIPIGVIYRPSEKKLKSVGKKDYLGKAKVVASRSPTGDLIDFESLSKLNAGAVPTWPPPEPRNLAIPVDEIQIPNISRSATTKSGTTTRPGQVEKPSKSSIRAPWTPS
ncbi:hypothetical protein CPB83DRAFT_898907 [Crepidotus variabilis]|uniref:NADPH oxidase regulator NoxR n=1 Tax=Crepidotus variabilis TaxID=179855 RepID=A0A9P6E6E1_9AGAR|nr:hypothetical protein CPB83DRAFT_898907 [Crepidotus variabilis]